MTETDNTESVVEEFKSPIRKLFPFFKNSRDKWKEKCKAAKYQLKLLRNQLRQLKKRDAVLKQEVNALKKELQHVRDKERKLIDEVERLKKNR
jgi:uncharacterized protein YlxW (UPF0749 family)